MSCLHTKCVNDMHALHQDLTTAWLWHVYRKITEYVLFTYLSFVYICFECNYAHMSVKYEYMTFLNLGQPLLHKSTLFGILSRLFRLNIRGLRRTYSCRWWRHVVYKRVTVQHKTAIYHIIRTQQLIKYYPTGSHTVVKLWQSGS